MTSQSQTRMHKQMMEQPHSSDKSLSAHRMSESDDFEFKMLHNSSVESNSLEKLGLVAQ